MTLDERMEQLEARVAQLEAKAKVLRVPKIRIQKPSDQEWLNGLMKLEAYRHINIMVEVSKMDAWLSLPANTQRKRTRIFVLKWLNRVHAPMQNGSTARPPAPPPKNDPIARGHWGKQYGDPKEYGYE